MNYRSLKFGTGSLLAALGLSLGAAEAQAGFTTINPPRGEEKTQEEILEHVYGGDFIASALNFSNGTISASRIEDTDTGLTDQIWSDAVVSATAEAVFAKYGQSFGYLAGTDDSTYTNLFDVAGKGFDAAGSATVDLSNQTWRWARNGETGVRSSQDSDNRNDRDHLTTYEIAGLDDGATTWLLFWEDKAINSDRDFNDLVVELKTASATPLPLPPAAWMGLSTLLGGGIVSQLRKLRRS